MPTIVVRFYDTRGGIYTKEFDFFGGEILETMELELNGTLMLRYPFTVKRTHQGDHYIKLAPENIENTDDMMCLNCRQPFVACDGDGCKGRKHIGWRTNVTDDSEGGM